MSDAAGYPMTTVRKDDLDVLVAACTSYLPDGVSPEVGEAFERLLEAFDEAHDIKGDEPAPDPEPLPDGFFGRVELPGWRNHTGWITDEVRFGDQMCVVRDWDGRVTAMVKLGPACQVLPLPTPLKRPEPPKAITSGSAWNEDDDEDDEDWALRD